MRNKLYTGRVTDLWQKLNKAEQDQLRDLLSDLETDFLLNYAGKVAYLLAWWMNYDDAMKQFDKQLQEWWVNMSDRWSGEPNVNEAFFSSVDLVRERLRLILPSE